MATSSSNAPRAATSTPAARRNRKFCFFADDPVSVFFLQIQGSGRVRFDDGTAARVNYDSQNGQPYTAVGKTLIQMGLPRDGMSMQVIRAWLKAHPADATRVMETDKSFVFFREEPVGDASEGAQGSEGVALTPGASLRRRYEIASVGRADVRGGDTARRRSQSRRPSFRYADGSAG